MMKRCLDEGVTQAYLDGELSPEVARDAAHHIAQCATCADALAAHESEDAFFASRFAPDETVTVPTELLRARINADIARLEHAPKASGERGGSLNLVALAAAFFSMFALAPRRAGAFAGLLAAVAFGFVFYAVQRQASPVEVAPPVQLAELRGLSAPQPSRATGVDSKSAGVEEESNRLEREGDGAVRRTASAHEATVANASVRRMRKIRPIPAARPAPAVEPNTEALLPGEHNYREAIASLTKAVEAGGDAVMTPRVRIEYERNIALLDRAIEDTRRVALRNPKNRDAVDFLMTAYQSKVDLLMTVADQTQVAALGR